MNSIPETAFLILKVLVLSLTICGVIEILFRLINKRIENQVLKEYLAERYNFNPQILLILSPGGEHIRHIVIDPGEPLQIQKKPFYKIYNHTEMDRLYSVKEQIITRRIIKYPDGKVVLEEERKTTFKNNTEELDGLTSESVFLRKKKEQLL